MNPPDADHFVISPLKVTVSNYIYMTLDTTKLILLGYFQTPLQSVIESSCYWCVGLWVFHDSCIWVSSSVSSGLYITYLLGIRNGK